MKSILIIFLALITVTSCKKDNKAEKTRLYIIADPGTYSTKTPTSIQISGTNIETINNVTSGYIVEANYPKGEAQTVTVMKVQGDPDITLEVSKGVSLNLTDRVAYAAGKGSVTVTFTP